LGYSLRVNVKKHEGSSAHAERQQQFVYRETQKETFATAGLPIISVDTKKKELIGNFKNAGQAWCSHPEEVNVHDFPSEALARAVPYGIYDVSKKLGSVYVGLSADTPAFAAAAMAR
jgi:Rhodopirellula transposase DDE domain